MNIPKGITSFSLTGLLLLALLLFTAVCPAVQAGPQDSYSDTDTKKFKEAKKLYRTAHQILLVVPEAV